MVPSAPPLPSRRRVAALAIALSASALGGCGTTDRTTTSSIPIDDYRVRHPIVLTDEMSALDVFPAPAMAGLDQRSAAQVAEFAQRYHDFGSGPITLFVPAGGRAPVAPGAVDAIGRQIARAGVRAPVRVVTYPITDAGLASPVRLTFTVLKAKVASRCGEWPRDLASGSSLDGWENRPYWNFGCANQTALAAQIADPRDLVAPHPESPADTLIRGRAIENIRKGTDPSTDWKTKNSSISNVGSN